MESTLETKLLSHIETIPSELLAVIITYLPLERRKGTLLFLSRHYRQGPLCLYFTLPLLLSDYSRLDDYDYFVEELLRDGSVEVIRYLLSLHPEWVSKEPCLLLYPHSSVLLEVLLEAGADLTARIDPLYEEEDDWFLAYERDEGLAYYRALNHHSKPSSTDPNYTTALHVLLLSCSYPTTVTIISHLQQTNNISALNVEDSERQNALYLLSVCNLSLKLLIDAGAMSHYDLWLGDRIEHQQELHTYAFRTFPSFRIEVLRYLQEGERYVTKWIGQYIDTAEYDFFAVRGLLLSLIYNISLTHRDVGHYKRYTRMLRVSSVSTDDYDGSLSFLRYVICEYYLGTHVRDKWTGKQKFQYTFDEFIDDPTIPYASVLSVSLPLRIDEYVGPLVPPTHKQRYILCTKKQEASYRKGMVAARCMLPITV